MLRGLTVEKKKLKMVNRKGRRVPISSLDHSWFNSHPNLNPHIFNHFNLDEVRQLLADFYSGLLTKHDHSAGGRAYSRRGLGSGLIGKVESREVKMILGQMKRMKPRPLPDLPVHGGWWVLCLEFWIGRLKVEDLKEEGLPEPRGEDIRSALVIFCNKIYRECFE